jgi:hypothetical protein
LFGLLSGEKEMDKLQSTNSEDIQMNKPLINGDTVTEEAEKKLSWFLATHNDGIVKDYLIIPNFLPVDENCRNDFIQYFHQNPYLIKNIRNKRKKLNQNDISRQQVLICDSSSMIDHPLLQDLKTVLSHSFSQELFEITNIRILKSKSSKIKQDFHTDFIKTVEDEERILDSFVNEDLSYSAVLALDGNTSIGLLAEEEPVVVNSGSLMIFNSRCLHCGMNYNQENYRIFLEIISRKRTDHQQPLQLPLQMITDKSEEETGTIHFLIVDQSKQTRKRKKRRKARR